ncbi:MAG: hypothetical protein MUO43_11245 [Desulfobacterales bacterium]|nr:hypothetical protein [Desulfobacterales bacterium]
MVALDNNAEILVEEFPLGIGVANYDRYTILFVITWTSTNLDIKPDEVEK